MLDSDFPEATDLETHRAEQAAEVEKVHKVWREKRACKVASIAERLAALLSKNAEAPPLEKMELAEFVIDVRLQESERKKSEGEAGALGERLTAANEAKATVVERLKEEFWNAMQTHQKAVIAVGLEEKVENFGLPKQSKEEMERLEKVLQLRRIERLDASSGQGHYSTSSLDQMGQSSRQCPAQMDWMLLVGMFKLGEEEEKEEEGGPEEGASEELKELIYHPMDVRSDFQRRAQLVLLSALKREQMESFNIDFDKLFVMKEELIETLNSKRGRMEEISYDLGIPLKEDWPTLSPEELPERVLAVTKEEMGIEKYIPKAERERLEREEKERQLRELEAAKDNLGERALQDMMNGRLEGDAERGLLAQEEEAAPEWMAETKAEDMTEAQKAEVEAWEARQKEAKEQREKLRKALELELKKMQVENTEMIKAFNEALHALFQRKLDILHVLNAIGLYEAQLHMSILEDAHLFRQTQQVETELVKARAASAKARNVLQAFTKQLEAKQGQFLALQEQDKQLEKAFRPAIQQAAAGATNGEALDGEDFKILQHLYRLRAGRTRSSLVGKSNCIMFYLCRFICHEQTQTKWNFYMCGCLL